MIWMVAMEAVFVSQLDECLYILLSLRDTNTPQRGEERLPTDKLFSQLSQQVTGTSFLSLYANKLSIHSTTQTQVHLRVVSSMCGERKQVCFFKYCMFRVWPGHFEMARDLDILLLHIFEVKVAVILAERQDLSKKPGMPDALSLN